MSTPSYFHVLDFLYRISSLPFKLFLIPNASVVKEPITKKKMKVWRGARVDHWIRVDHGQ